MEKLKRVMNGEIEPNIFPLLWIHGEDHAAYAREIEHIYASGIRSFCVEARPHCDFNGPKWFDDLAFILEESRKKGMQVWLLDDSHFPTGYANGEVKKHFPELQKKFLVLKTLDFMGPIKGSGAILRYLVHEDDRILGIYLQRRLGFENVDVNDSIDLTDSLVMVNDWSTGKQKSDLLGNPVSGTTAPCPVVCFDLPDGQWSLQVLAVTCHGGEKETEGYLNPIVPEATDVLLNTIYEPVYEHLKEFFGSTFRGFFSDEPRFGNIHGAEGASIGRNSAMPLPWCEGMTELLLEACRSHGGMLEAMTEEKLRRSLPLLFIGESDYAHALRYVYMDLVSDLYSKNFDGRIAEWCHVHNCERIGHTIEDNGAASRLGYGAGHIFRAMEHADMAGIDVVIHQLMPGFDNGLYKGMHSPGWDGRFFTYLLGKFGGSLAHLDPKKKGRAMCELYGAYGWAEGNRLMKWLTDYMLVNGINHLVPHAFDASPFPNPDCPPQLCGEEHNPQYTGFRILMDYAGRLCSLMTGGVNITPAALYFNAEGEWSGDWQSSADAASVLGRNQIDYDLISMDYLLKGTVKDGLLHVNTECFKVLILPYAQALPCALLDQLVRFASLGLKIVFLDELPLRTSEGTAVPEELARIITVIETEELADYLWQMNLYEIKTDHPVPMLHYYHYRQNDGDLYFFVNMDGFHEIETKITGLKTGSCYTYDAFENTLTVLSEPESLKLPPYGSKLIVIPDQKIDGALTEKVFSKESEMDMDQCSVYIQDMEHIPDGGDFIRVDQFTSPCYLSLDPEYAAFSGLVRYVFNFELDDKQAEKSNVLVLEGVREGAKVSFNGEEIGKKIVPDYRFELPAAKPGINQLIVELDTTLGRKMNDFLSQFIPVEPVGMCSARIETGTFRKEEI